MIASFVLCCSKSALSAITEGVRGCTGCRQVPPPDSDSAEALEAAEPALTRPRRESGDATGMDARTYTSGLVCHDGAGNPPSPPGCARGYRVDNAAAPVALAERIGAFTASTVQQWIGWPIRCTHKGSLAAFVYKALAVAR
jgi:hypothetical protein